MWLSAANPSYTVDPAIPESQIPVTDKEGNEVSLIDFIPDPNMSPEDRAILVEKTEQILEDLNNDKLPIGWDESVLSNPTLKSNAIEEVQNALNKLLNVVEEPVKETTTDKQVQAPPPGPEAEQLAQTIDALLDNPEQFKKIPKFSKLSETEFNEEILNSLKQAILQLNEGLSLYYREDEVNAKLQNIK